MSTTAVIPQPPGAEFIELARKASGSLFDKHVISAGPLIHPVSGKTIPITEEMLDQAVRNFQAGLTGPVSVPLADDRNRHSEAPERNTGEVIGLRREGKQLIATMDIRDPSVAQKIRDGRILGSSAFLHLDATDTRTGRKIGPALLHQCLTNRPYVTDLQPFVEVAASAGLDGDLVMLTSTDPGDAMTFATDADTDSLTLTQDDLAAAAVQLSALEDAWLADEQRRLSGLAYQVSRGGPLLPDEDGHPAVPETISAGRVALAQAMEDLGWEASPATLSPDEVDSEVARLSLMASQQQHGQAKAAVDGRLELAMPEHREFDGAHRGRNLAFGLARDDRPNMDKFGPVRRGQRHTADLEDELGEDPTDYDQDPSGGHDRVQDIIRRNPHLFSNEHARVPLLSSLGGTKTSYGPGRY